MEDEIKICYNHLDYQVPLIWTFAFVGAEYWCPYCSYIGGMFGSGENVPATTKLAKRLKAYEKFTEDYLHANAIQVCHQTKWKGKYIKPNDLPQEEKDRLEKIRGEWKYKVKMEETV